MTVVYPIRRQKEYTALRYSLRSLKFLTKPFEVVIVGDQAPEWVTKVTQIGVADVPNNKQLSIKKKIASALRLYEEILFMNDDIYLTKPQDSFPWYHSDTLTLKGYGETGAKPLYNQLLALKKPVKHFDLHYPVIYDQRFLEAMTHFSDDVIIKSAYCNWFEIKGEPRRDNKIVGKAGDIKTKIADLPSFSSGVYTLNPCVTILNQFLYNKSNFEV